MLHIAVILYDDKRMFGRINVNNNGWSGTRPTWSPHLTIKAPLNGVFALNHVQLCRQVCILVLLNFSNGRRKIGAQEPVVSLAYRYMCPCCQGRRNTGVQMVVYLAMTKLKT